MSGLFDGILGFALPALGTALGGPVGGALGTAIAGGISSSNAQDRADEGAQQAIQVNAASADKQMAFQREMANSAQSFSQASADKQMEFQERMSSSAYQRAMNDMQLAGLNPMLAAHQGGESSPSGASAQGVSAQGARFETENTKLAGLNTAIQYKNVEADLQKKFAEVEKTKAETDLVRGQLKADIPGATGDELRGRVGLSSVEYNRVLTEIDRLKKEIPKIESETARTSAEERLVKAETRLKQLEEPRACNVADTQSSWWMRNVSPYLSDSVRSVTSGLGLQRLISR